MNSFPDWVKVQFFDIDQYYNMSADPYQEMDDIRHGDLNRIAAHTDQSNETFGDENENLKWKRTSGCEAYITFFQDKLTPSSKKPALGAGLDDEDEFEDRGELPDIGLVFNDGVYVGYGMGGNKFSQIVASHFEPYRNKPGNYDAILDAALKEIYGQFTVGRIANDIDNDMPFEHETWSV